MGQYKVGRNGNYGRVKRKGGVNGGVRGVIGPKGGVSGSIGLAYVLPLIEGCGMGSRGFMAEGRGRERGEGKRGDKSS